MSLKNSADKFSTLTKLLHWSIFILFIVQYFLVYRREYFPKESPEKLQYLLLHESIGTCLLLLALLMIIWRHVGVRPKMPATMSPAHQVAAKIVHFLLYLTMLIQPLSGLAMSELGGYKPNVFGLFNVPIVLAKNQHLGKIVYSVHVWCSYVIIGIVSAHLLAALYHHFVVKDNILKRMLPSC